MADLLLSSGCSPNEYMVVGNYKITTPWLIWLTIHNDRTSPYSFDLEGRPGPHESPEILGVAESFLTAGAAPLPDPFCLVVWVEGAFIKHQEGELVK